MAHQQDECNLHKLCRNGDLKKIMIHVENLDEELLAEKIASRKGVFGYTPFHEAVASDKADVLDYLLRKTKNAYVNCRANSGYTPLHLASSSGHIQCTKKLLEHSADIFANDEFGKTPKQTARLSAKTKIIRLLTSEGEYYLGTREMCIVGDIRIMIKTLTLLL